MASLLHTPPVRPEGAESDIPLHVLLPVLVFILLAVWGVSDLLARAAEALHRVRAHSGAVSVPGSALRYLEHDLADYDHEPKADDGPGKSEPPPGASIH